MPPVTTKVRELPVGAEFSHDDLSHRHRVTKAAVNGDATTMRFDQTCGCPGKDLDPATIADYEDMDVETFLNLEVMFFNCPTTPPPASID